MPTDAFAFKNFVLSIFEWPLKTGFTLYVDSLITQSILTDPKHNIIKRLFFVFFYLILYIPVTNLSVMLGRVFLG